MLQPTTAVTQAGSTYLAVLARNVANVGVLPLLLLLLLVLRSA